MENIPFDRETLQPILKELGAYKRGTAVEKIEPLGGGGFGLAYGLTYADGKTEVLKVFKVGDML